MKKYHLVPGPSLVAPDVLQAYVTNFYSPDLEDDFFALYEKVTTKLGSFLKISSGSVVIQSGEGMLALWSALKSCVTKGDKVFCIANGIFGDYLVDMSKDIGAECQSYVSPSDTPLSTEDYAKIEEQIQKFSPKMVTMIHCETPCGTLNSLKEIGAICQKYGALFCVDAVSSAFGAEVNFGECYVDLGLVGSQKCLSLPPDISILAVSEKAWKVVDQVSYAGYDALKPFKNAIAEKYFPYTHNWRAISALDKVLTKIEAEGYDKVLERHSTVAEFCKKTIVDLGLKLYSKDAAFCSPTVTAVYVPSGWTWAELDSELRKKGVVMGGSYGNLAGKVFRVGHMGTQAELELIKESLAILAEVLKSKKV